MDGPVLNLPTSTEQSPAAWQPVEPEPFNALLLHIRRGKFFGPTKRSFRFHARLGEHEERSALILSKTPDTEFDIDNVLKFPYTPNHKTLAITARLEARTDKYLGRVFIDLSGVSIDRSTLKAQIPLSENDGTRIGLFDVRVDLGYDESLPSNLEFGDVSPSSPFNFNHAMTPAGLARRFGLMASPANSAYLSPKAGDRITAEIPFRGLNVTVTIGSDWTVVASRKIQCCITVGKVPMRSKELVQVTPDGDFKMDMLFRYRFEGERLILLSVETENGDPVGDAVVDARMMIDMGIVTCVQNLQFYTRMGTIAGCARVIFDFSYKEIESPRVFQVALPNDPKTSKHSYDTASPTPTHAISPSGARVALPYDQDETTAPGLTFRDWSSPSPMSQTGGGNWNGTNEPTSPRSGVQNGSPAKMQDQSPMTDSPVHGAATQDIDTAPPSPKAGKASKRANQGSASPSQRFVVDPRSAADPRPVVMKGLLCSITRLYDYVPGTMNCAISTVLGEHQASSELISCTFQDTAIRRIYCLPFDGQDELLVRCAFADASRYGEGKVPLPLRRSDGGLRELQLTDDEGNYMGRVELWLQLTPTIIFPDAPGVMAFAESPEYRNLMLPPSQMAALAMTESEGGSPSRSRHRSGRLVVAKKEGAPTTPRCLGSPTGWRPKDSRYIPLLEPLQNTFPEFDEKDQWEPARTNASTIFFKVHGFRNLPDVYRCESMKVVIIARMGSMSVASSPFRLPHVDPDLVNCVFRLPRMGHRFVRIDLLEVTLLKSPLQLGHFVWDAMRADQLDGVDHGYTKMSQGSTYCLHTAMLSAEDSTNPAFFGINDAVPLELPQLDVMSSQGSSSIPMELGEASPTTPSATASLVLLAKIVHNLRTPFPFTHVEVFMEVEMGTFSQRSEPALSNRFHRVPLNARFRLPLIGENRHPPLIFRLFAATAVNESRLIAQGFFSVDQKAVQGGVHTSVMLEYVEESSVAPDDQPPLLEISLRRSSRVVRAPECEKLSSNRTIASGVPISAF